MNQTAQPRLPRAIREIGLWSSRSARCVIQLAAIAFLLAPLAFVSPARADDPPPDVLMERAAEKAAAEKAAAAKAAAQPVPAAQSDATANARAQLPHELSPWTMFLSADIVVKAVMVGLAFASLASWTVFLAKFAELSMGIRSARRGKALLAGEASITSASTALANKRGIAAALVESALAELRLSSGLTDKAGIKERVASRLTGDEARAARVMKRATGLLASVGATAPFVGLFGTVWGIMNSFIGISKAQTTNLAVVAPGIAEALLATAIGLVAAIPAVLMYNYLTRLSATLKAEISDASDEVARLVSRDLDRLASGAPVRAVRAAE